MRWEETDSIRDSGRLALAVGDEVPVRHGPCPEKLSDLNLSRVPDEIRKDRPGREKLLKLAQAGISEQWLGTLLSRISLVAQVSAKHGKRWHLPQGVRWQQLKTLPKKAKSLGEHIERVNKQRPELYALADPWQYPARLFPDLPKTLRDYAQCLDTAIADLGQMRRRSGQGTMLDVYLRPTLVRLIAGTDFATGRAHYSELAELLWCVVPEQPRFVTANLERFGQEHKKKVKAEKKRLNQLASVGIIPLPPRILSGSPKTQPTS